MEQNVQNRAMADLSFMEGFADSRGHAERSNATNQRRALTMVGLVRIRRHIG